MLTATEKLTNQK